MLAPVAATQDDLIPVFVDIGGHVAEIGTAPSRNPAPLPSSPGECNHRRRMFHKLFAVANDFFAHVLFGRFRHGGIAIFDKGKCSRAGLKA